MSSVQRPRVGKTGPGLASAFPARDSPLPRWGSSSSSLNSVLYRKYASKGTILFVAALLLIGVFSINSGERSPIFNRHRKLSGNQRNGDSQIRTQVVSTQKDDKVELSLDEEIHAPIKKQRSSESVITTTENRQTRLKVDHTATQRLPAPHGLYELHAMDIDGNDVSMADYAGKVLLILNVASACGYTEQNYKGLQALYEKYGSYGLEIIAFPSNQFGGQEPGTDQHIKEFVTRTYHVTFKMMSKIDVNGPETHPVFRYLKKHLPVDQGGGGGVAPGNDLVWNFNKFLVDKHGQPVAFYYQSYDASRLESDVFRYLSAS